MALPARWRPRSGAEATSGWSALRERRLRRGRERRRGRGSRGRCRLAERRRRGRSLLAGQLQALSGGRRRRRRSAAGPPGAAASRRWCSTTRSIRSPETHAPLGRRLASATIDGEDVLGSLVGPGVHQLEHGAKRGTLALDGRRSRPFYAPIPGEPTLLRSEAEPTDAPVELVLDGEPAPIRRVVDLVNSAGSYIRRDGYAGDCGADLPDDDQWSASGECFAASGGALVTTASALAARRALRAQLLRLLRGHRLVLAGTAAGLSGPLRPGDDGAPCPRADERRHPRGPDPVPRREEPNPHARPLRPPRSRVPGNEEEVVRRRRRRCREDASSCGVNRTGPTGAPAPALGTRLSRRLR